ncbi:hypothetical protein ACHAQJ_003862 [Trichoderma viride]
MAAPSDEQPSPESNCHHVSADGNPSFTPATNSEQVESASLESSPRSVQDDDATANSNETALQANMVEPQHVHDDAFQDDNPWYQRPYTSMPYSPPPSPPSSLPPPYHSNFSRIPSPSTALQETIQRRNECLLRLQRGDQPDPFGEWANLASGTYGGTIPPEFYLSSAPFALHSLRGRARLRFIRNAFCMSTDTSVFDIQGFLGRNPFIINYLSSNVVPNPDLVLDNVDGWYSVGVEDYDSRMYNWDLLHAIKELAWTDVALNQAVRLSKTDKAALSTMRKLKQVYIMTDVYQKMLEKDPQLTEMKRLHKKIVAGMRRNRPNSLLRNAAMPEDVTE